MTNGGYRKRWSRTFPVGVKRAGLPKGGCAALKCLLVDGEVRYEESLY